MRVLLVLGASLVVVAPSFAPAQQAVAPAPETKVPTSGAKIWLGRYAEFEEYLRTAPIERIEDVGQGVTNPKRVFFSPGGLAESAVAKPLRPGRRQAHWESYKSEIAAYELDRLLGLDMVPVTVERTVEGAQASVQLWMTDCRHYSDLKSQRSPNPRKWSKDIYRLRAFDAVIGNIDRNSGNMLVDEDWNIILIDHSRAFSADRMPREKEITRLDRKFFAALKALDEETVRKRLGPWLFEASIRDLLSRRDKIVSKLEKLAEEKGSLAVFAF